MPGIIPEGKKNKRMINAKCVTLSQQYLDVYSFKIQVSINYTQCI